MLGVSLNTQDKHNLNTDHNFDIRYSKLLLNYITTMNTVDSIIFSNYNTIIIQCYFF